MSESVILSYIEMIIHQWIKYANYWKRFATLYDDVHNNVAFTNGEILTFWCQFRNQNCSIIRESCIRAHVLMNLLKYLGKTVRCEANLFPY